MVKVKVRKEMGLALERVFEKGLQSRLGREGYLIYNYLNNSFSFENKILRQLSLEEITKLSFEGYEIEITPEEKIVDRVKEILNSDLAHIQDGYLKGLVFALDTYEIKIKGVNC